MRHATLFGGLTGLGLVAAGAAAAQDRACRVATFPLDQRAFGQSRITPGPPIHLAADPIGCPDGMAACRQPPFAVSGDVVLTGRPRGPWVCVYRPSRGGGGVAGWAPGRRLSALPAEAAPPLHAWLGRWTYGRNWIEISRDGNELAGKGHAAWPSVYPIPQEAAGDKRSAKFSAQSLPSGNRLEFKNGEYNDQGACTVSLVLVGRYIVAEDDGRCGGRNVTFTGVYERRR